MLIGALGAGGTKTVCAIGTEDGAVLERTSIPTTTPGGMTSKLIKYFEDKEVAALGVGALGSVDVNTKSETFSYILDTPKLVWHHRDLIGGLRDVLKILVGLDTDVDRSHLREVTYGHAKGLDSVIYTAMGTGVDAGAWVNGGLLHGMLYPEGGHALLACHPKDSKGDICPYHKSCLEGFTSGPSIEKRQGKKAVDLVDNKEAWGLRSYYVARSLVDYILLFSPQEIILGGGVIHQIQLFPTIREKVLKQLNGYINTEELQDMENYIVLASLNDDQGVMGCTKPGLNVLEASR